MKMFSYHRKCSLVRLMVGIFLSAISAALAPAQVIECTPIQIDVSGYNRFNAEGLKEGPWLERRTRLFYSDGYIYGIVISYEPDGRIGLFSCFDGISAIGAEAIVGNPTMAVLTNYGPNVDFKDARTDHGSHIGDMQAYVYDYDVRTGRLLREGWFIFFEEDGPIPDPVEVGFWRYYDEDGNVTYIDMEYPWRLPDAQWYNEPWRKRMIECGLFKPDK